MLVGARPASQMRVASARVRKARVPGTAWRRAVECNAMRAIGCKRRREEERRDDII